MKMFLVDVKNQTLGVRDVQPKLEEYYRLLDCDTIDIVERQVGGKYFDIICDDEGLLKENPIPSALNKKGELMLVGNLLLCHHDNEGNETELSDKDVRLITNNCVNFILEHVEDKRLRKDLYGILMEY